MKNALACLVFCALFASGAMAMPVWPPEQPTLIRGALGYVPIPGAIAAPDKSRTYKAIFDTSKAAAKPGDPVSGVLFAATDLSALRGQGVPAANAKFALIFHGPAVDGLLKNDLYKKKYGVDNPNLPILAALKKEGADILICGQMVIAEKIDPATLTPDVAIGSEAFIVLITYQNNGYAALTF